MQKSLTVLFGERIREVRESRGLSLSHVARECDTSNSRVRSWELGETPVTGDHIERLARVFGCSPFDLLPNASGEPGFILTERERALIDAARRANVHDLLAIVASLVSEWGSR